MGINASEGKKIPVNWGDTSFSTYFKQFLELYGNKVGVWAKSVFNEALYVVI